MFEGLQAIVAAWRAVAHISEWIGLSVGALAGLGALVYFDPPARKAAIGGGIAVGGGIRDVVSSLASSGALGRALTDPSTGYSVVYHIEIALLFATLIAIGPLVRTARTGFSQSSSKFGLAEFPG
jgi:PUCC protein